jgi:uncharacterized protein (DUF983 family)
MLHVIVALLRSFGLRCPHCHRGKVMRNWFAVHSRCSECDYVFQAEQGDFWGGMIFAYTYAGILAMGLAAALYAYDLFSMETRVYVTALFAAAMVLALHPWTRCNWIAVIYVTRSRDPSYLPAATRGAASPGAAGPSPRR